MASSSLVQGTIFIILDISLNLLQPLFTLIRLAGAMSDTEYLARVVFLDQDKVFLLMPDEWWSSVEECRLRNLQLQKKSTPVRTMTMSEKTVEDWPTLQATAAAGPPSRLNVPQHAASSTEGDTPLSAPLCHIRCGRFAQSMAHSIAQQQC